MEYNSFKWFHCLLLLALNIQFNIELIVNKFLRQQQQQQQLKEKESTNCKKLVLLCVNNKKLAKGIASKFQLKPAVQRRTIVVHSQSQPAHLLPIVYCNIKFRMGTCLGHSNTINADDENSLADSELTAPTTTCFWHKATDAQDVELISNASDKYHKNNFISRLLKFKNKKQKKRTQFIDRFWDSEGIPNYVQLTNTNRNDSYSDIQLQNLDVHNLIQSASYAKESNLNNSINGYAVTSSRASSSLDLEWEHEYSHMRQMRYQQHHHSCYPNYQQTQQLQHQQQQPQHTRQINCLHSSSTFNQITLDKDLWQDENHSDNSDVGSQLVAQNPSNVNQIHCERRIGKCTTNRLNGNANANGNGNGNGTITRNSSQNNSWSHISTPESLEWDIDEEQQRQLHVEDDNLDHDTLQLLHEIEQLKNRVLNETGDVLYRDNGDMAGVGGGAAAGGGIEFRANHFERFEIENDIINS